MTVRVKICGVTSTEAVRAAVKHGANALGFVFAESPREVTVERAVELAADIPPFVARVAVFHHPALDHVLRVCAGFAPDVVQVEPDPPIVDLLRDRFRLLPVLHDHPDLLADLESSLVPWSRGVLLEASGRGGQGRPPDRERARQLADRVPLMLAGGLDPDNVGGIVDDVRPYGVDVSSGVEREPGVKDPGLIARFLDAARAAGSGRGLPTGSGAG